MGLFGTHADPHSETYRLSQAARALARSATAGDAVPEMSEGDEQAISHAVSCLNLPPQSTVVEFGADPGFAAVALAKAGFRVVSVKADQPLANAVRRQAASAKVSVTVLVDELALTGRLEEPVDALFFFKALHHAVDHQALLESLDVALRPGGKALFVSEPITPKLPMPWGALDDGSIAFSESYFVEALARVGWIERRHRSEKGLLCFEAKRRRVWDYSFAGGAREIHSAVGERSLNSLRVKADKPSYFLYGPFVPIPEGLWKATFTLRGFDGELPSGQCSVDVCSVGHIFAARELELSELAGGPLSLEFYIPTLTPAVEVRLFNKGPVSVEILQLDISPLT